MKIVFFFPVFFFLFFFFFSFYLLFLLKPSPIFFISSFLSPTGFSVPHKHLTATPYRPPTPPPVTAATWIYLHDHFYSILNYDKPTILSEKQEIAHNQLNAEGLVSSGAQKAIKEIGNRSQGGEEKHLPPPPPLSGGRGKKKKNNSSQDQQDLFPHFSTP